MEKEWQEVIEAAIVLSATHGKCIILQKGINGALIVVDCTTSTSKG